jgi:hypothetical protein
MSASHQFQVREGDDTERRRMARLARNEDLAAALIMLGL